MAKPKDSLDAEIREELSEYSHEERLAILKNAIVEMAGAGIFTPEETKHFLKNIEKWLIEIMEH